jgi:hypothetical protein
MSRPVCLLYVITVLSGVAVVIPTASAGWVCIKNESKFTLLVREVPARPTIKRGKTMKLLPGEVYREHQTTVGERRVQVYDARDPTKPLCSTQLTWPAKDDVTYKLEVVERVMRLTPVVSAKSPAPPIVQVGSPKR